jgi:hypothetical protein
MNDNTHSLPLNPLCQHVLVQITEMLANEHTNIRYQQNKSDRRRYSSLKKAVSANAFEFEEL